MGNPAVLSNPTYQTEFERGPCQGNALALLKAQWFKLNIKIP